MKHNLAVVINYCTNDYKFISHNIRECLKFSNKIIVIYSDYFFNGHQENFKLINKTIKENPKAKFIKLKFINNKTKFFWDNIHIFSRIVGKFFLYGSQYWICKERFLGFQNTESVSKFTLFLDADEIPDGGKINKWLNTNFYQKFNLLKLANYWYFRKSTYQATTFEDSPIIVKNSALNPKLLLSRNERQNVYLKIKSPKQRMVLGIDQKPMIHHYCWVRTKQEMLKKTQTWGHNFYCNWKKYINKEFSHKFNGTDFIQGYKYKKIKKPFKNIKI